MSEKKKSLEWIVSLENKDTMTDDLSNNDGAASASEQRSGTEHPEPHQKGSMMASTSSANLSGSLSDYLEELP